MDPRDGNYGTKQLSRIVGELDRIRWKLAFSFMSRLQKNFPVSEIKIAELAKVYENTFRAVNIALVNELMLLCDQMKISVWETLDAAYTKPLV